MPSRPRSAPSTTGGWPGTVPGQHHSDLAADAAGGGGAGRGGRRGAVRGERAARSPTATGRRGARSRSTARPTPPAASPGTRRQPLRGRRRGAARPPSSSNLATRRALRGGAGRRGPARRRADRAVGRDARSATSDRRAVGLPAALARLEAVPGARARRRSTCAPSPRASSTRYVDCSRDAHGPWDYLGGLLVCREAGAVVADAFDRELVVLDHAARRTPVAARHARRCTPSSSTARRSFRVTRAHAPPDCCCGCSGACPTPRPIARRAHARADATRSAPSASSSGPTARVLLVRHTYRQRWGVPGGLLNRGEEPRDAARREALEEVGLRVELVGEPAVVVDPGPRRVDVIFRARPADGADPDDVRPTLARDRRVPLVPRGRAARAAARDGRGARRAGPCETAGRVGGLPRPRRSTTVAPQPGHARVAQLRERLGLDLADPLPREVEARRRPRRACAGRRRSSPKRSDSTRALAVVEPGELRRAARRARARRPRAS